MFPSVIDLFYKKDIDRIIKYLEKSDKLLVTDKLAEKNIKRVYPSYIEENYIKEKNTENINIYRRK